MTTTTEAPDRLAPTPTEHVDVLIVGAGLSGIGAAGTLQRELPGATFAILEARGTLGGTWDLFRYPGIRSDSDMFTLGFSAHPWKGEKAIADGADILDYLTETARTTGVDSRIRYHRKVVSADWSTPEGRWRVLVEDTETGERSTLTCGFLHACAGYYRYDEGYTPTFPGSERFQGQVVHPQHWPADLDTTGKKVVVIGSGATAVTLVPALARTSGHVTMLQRSPSYVVSRPGKDRVSDFLRDHLPAQQAHTLVKWKNVVFTNFTYGLARKRPDIVKKAIRKGQEKLLPAGYDIDTHFTPSYDPWDQRICAVPDGDLFTALSDGSASVVTDTIDTWTETGILLSSGQELEADIIVTATGLNLQMAGGLQLAVDGEPVVQSKTFVYKGMMLSGVPNFAFTIGYTNASWTLKADLVAGFVTRLVKQLRSAGLRQCTPEQPGADEPTLPLMDFSSGYVQRALKDLPVQGTRAPWTIHQNYRRDLAMFRRGQLEDGVMRFSNPVPR